jgi:CBS domain-containing protein
LAPRAASRLESFGFEKVFYYKPGKADWLAQGLPAIRENREPETLWVVDHMQRELPICQLDEAVGQAGARAEQRGYSVCPVVNENGIVLGVIGKRDWDTDPTASVEQLMDSAPTTLRPSDPLGKAQQLLQKPDHAAVLVTDSDGKLLGTFLGASNNAEPIRSGAR